MEREFQLKDCCKQGFEAATLVLVSDNQTSEHQEDVS